MRYAAKATALLITLLSAGLTSCMMGPNFHAPAAPPTQQYTESPQPKKTTNTPAAGNAGKQQNIRVGADIPGAWWYLFHSCTINSLIHEGLLHSPNLFAAKATLVQAQENLNAIIGGDLFPNVSAQLTGERELFNGTIFGSTTPATIFNLYNASINVSYTLDVFGALRRQVEGYAAQVDYERFELDAAYLTLTSNIVTTAITAATYAEEIAATKTIVKALRRELDIMKQQLALGGVSGNDYYSQLTQLAQTEGTLPPLEQSLTQARHALAVLIGALPSSFTFPTIDLDKIDLPTNLPVSLPSVLVRQRPDVRASEALLHYASAQVGVATANLFPQFTLTGSYGYQSLVPNQLFKKATNVWSWGGSLLQPIFNGGQLQAERRAAIAAYQVALAQYHQTVLQAFQNVADALRAVQFDAYRLKYLKAAEIAARKSWQISLQQYHLGGVTYIVLLTAEKQYQQALISRVQAQSLRYNDTAALFQAVGGGWWNATEKFQLHNPQA